MREALADGAAWSKLCGPCRRVLVKIGAESRAFLRKASSPCPPNPAVPAGRRPVLPHRAGKEGRKEKLGIRDSCLPRVSGVFL